jgi:hypothetical protein
MGDGLGREAVAVGLATGGTPDDKFPSRMAMVMPTITSRRAPQARTTGLRTL